MDLNNIQLPDIVVEELYRNALIDEPANIIAVQQEINSKPSFKFLGNNNARICIIVDNPTDIFLPDQQLELLIKLLTACNLTIADVAILNFGAISVQMSVIRERLSPHKALLLGVTTSQLEIPFDFPFFKLQEHGDCTYIQAPSLATMIGDSEESKEIKTKLWNCLKQMFGIGKKQ